MIRRKALHQNETEIFFKKIWNGKKNKKYNNYYLIALFFSASILYNTQLALKI